MQLLSQTKIEFSSSAREIDSNGFMFVERVPMFRSGIIEIPGIELQGWVPEKLDYGKKYRLRIEQSVIEGSYNTFAHKPVTWGHKWVGKNNPRSDFIGFTGDSPVVEGDLICNNLTIADVDAVNRINMKEREELSAGFVGEISKSSVGYADYDLISMECNHVAVVKKGKAGHRVRILNEMIDNGEIAKDEIKGGTMGEEVKEEIKEDKTTEEVAPATDKEVENKPQEVDNADAVKEDTVEADKGSEKAEEKPTEAPAEKEEEKPADKPAEAPAEKAPEETPKEEPKEEKKEEPKEELHAWAYKIDGVVDINDKSQPDISGKSVTISFSAEDGFYEVKDGCVARIAMEDIINERAEDKAKSVVEAYSICKEIDNNIKLRTDSASMYRSAAKLVFGKDIENESETVLKCMLQGYLLGKGAKLSDKCDVKQDFRTIEVNL